MKRNKHISRKLISSLLALMLVFVFSAPVTVMAAEPINPEKDASLTIIYKDGDKVIKGAFSIYRVADVNESAKMKLTEQFSSYPVELKGLDQDGWMSLATTLEGYAKRDKIDPVAKATVGDDGTVSVTLKPGLYLVTGEKKKVGSVTYTSKSFMIFLPNSDIDNNTWEYNVNAEVKYEKSRKPVGDPGDDPESVSRKVLKIWDDKGYEDKRPEYIMVDLLCDGKVYDTQKLTAENSWRYTWDNLSEDHDWIVVEKEISDYTTIVNLEGITFTVTNKFNPPDNPPDDPDDPDKPDNPDNPDKPDKPDNPSDNPNKNPTNDNGGKTNKPKLPQTGVLWWPVPVLVSAGLVFCIIGILRRRMNSDEE